MMFLNLNCQHGIQPKLKDFLRNVLYSGKYDFLLLQEVNEDVIKSLANSSYRLVRSFNDDIGKESDLCIVYRREYNFISKGFKSFATMRKDPVRGFKHPAFGILLADILIDDKIYRLSVAHLHSGINRKIRIIETQLIKNFVLDNMPDRFILAGDFLTQVFQMSV